MGAECTDGTALQISNLHHGRPPTIRSASSFHTAIGDDDDLDSDSESEHPELGSTRSAQPPLPPLKTTDLGPAIREEGSSRSDLELVSSSVSRNSDDSPATPYEHSAAERDNWEGTREKEMTETRKLQVIVEEYGEISTIMENRDGSPAESERIIAESHGSLYRYVIRFYTNVTELS